MPLSKLLKLLTVLAALLSLLPAGVPTPVSAEDDAPSPPLWPVTGGGPLRQGYTQLQLPSAGKLRWRTELPGAGLVGSSPVVDGQQRSFILTNDTLTSSPLSVLYCLSSTGSIHWRQQLADRFSYQPVLLSNGRLLLYSFSKQLYCFTGEGELLWRRQYSASPRIGESETWANYSAGLTRPLDLQALPDRSGGVLVVDDTPALLCIDAAGERRWDSRLPAACSGGMTLFNGLVYLPGNDGKVMVFRADDGQPQASLQPRGLSDSYSTGLPGAGLLLLSSGGLGERVVLLPQPGVKAFDYRLDYRATTAISVSSRSLLVLGCGTAGSADGLVPTRGQVLALDSKGKRSWSRDFGTVPAGQILLDSSGRCCFGTADAGAAGVYCFSPQRGVEWWINTAGANCVYPITDGLVGVVVVSERPGANKNQCIVLGIGN